LLLEYFNVKGAWDRLWNQCREFRENITLLQGRALWAANLVEHFDNALSGKGDLVVDVTAELKEAAAMAVRSQKVSVRNMVKKAFELPRSLASGDVSTETAMLTLYAAIQLDAEDSKLSEKMIDTLIINSTVSVHDNRALLRKEPIVRTSVCETVESHLKGAAKDYYRKQLSWVVETMVSGSLLLTHSSLGECAEPLLCHSLLMASSNYSGPISLWQLFRPFLGYLERYASSDDPALSLQAKRIRKELELTKCEIRVCKNLSHVKPEKTDGNELKCLFKKIPPEYNETNLNSEYICFLLNHFAGADICFLTRPPMRGPGSVIIQSKLILNGTFKDAAITTDPNLQYLTNHQRSLAVEGHGVGKPSKARFAYDKMRQQLGEEDPFNHCNRFVAALMFTEETKKDAVLNYEFGAISCPLLPLDLKEGLPIAGEKKEELSREKQMTALTDMDTTCPLWGSVQVQYGSQVQAAKSCENASSAATSRRGASSAATPRRGVSSKKRSK
jgi:hypothetical protein